MLRIKWFNLTLLTIAALAVIVWASNSPNSSQVNPDSMGQGYTCNANTVSGTYIHASFGTILPDNPLGLPAGPYNAVGTSVLRGDGTYELTSKSVINGAAINEHIEGTFTIGENCGITFYNGDIPAVFTYGTTGHINVMGVSLFPGTNVTYLITRK